jgi:hypothetical protein
MLYINDIFHKYISYIYVTKTVSASSDEADTSKAFENYIKIAICHL